jgi:aspartyl-tRNA(Asn)/glutamyl-tRNA(Gln) amidotransferase subunit A
MTVPLLTIAEAARLIATKQLSPVELTSACLDRVAALDPVLHSFIAVTAETALASARVAEAEIMAKGPRSRLHGIPLGLKDIVKTKGVATTAHSRLLQDYVPDQDATCAARLTSAGAVTLGKLATHEFAMGGPSFDLPWPPARNPWDPDYFTSGSSSGTGAAVAAGLVLGGVGTDTGGSIRAPSALCGIAGLKATYGRISRAGVLPLAYSLDHAGPMAWTVEDVAIMLQALASYDPEDPASADQPVPDYHAGLGDGVKGMRIGVVRHFYETDVPATPAVTQGVEDAIAVYRAMGAEIRDIVLPPLADWHACGFLIMLAEAFAAHEPWLTTRFSDYGELLRNSLALGALVSGPDYVQAMRRRRELNAAIATAAADCDLLLTATWQSEAPPIKDVAAWGIFGTPIMTFPFNVCGWPALSVCSGFGAHGMPVAIQLAAKPFAEPLLLRAGHAYEMATPWRHRRPAMAETPAVVA